MMTPGDSDAREEAARFERILNDARNNGILPARS